MANRELLSLYFGVGKYISENSRKGFWGTGAIKVISENLQKEMPGLRGFSESNLKNMRIFYEEWEQYRLEIANQEYFIDLLFFNRKLQSLVAVELKRGKFKPEYLGKLNFYLSVLDDLVSLPHENPSIGIILCKEKNNRVVEYAFRDMTKSMGVATYKTASKLPAKYKNILPDAEKLKELL